MCLACEAHSREMAINLMHAFTIADVDMKPAVEKAIALLGTLGIKEMIDASLMDDGDVSSVAKG